MQHESKAAQAARAMLSDGDLTKAQMVRLQSHLAADDFAMAMMRNQIARLKEVAQFLAESIQKPHMKTQDEALAVYRLEVMP